MCVYQKLKQLQRTSDYLLLILFKLDKVIIVQNSETVGEYLLNTVGKGECHQLKQMILLKVLLHVFDNLFLETLNLKVLNYSPHFKYPTTRAFKKTTIKALHYLLKTVFLNKC